VCNLPELPVSLIWDRSYLHANETKLDNLMKMAKRILRVLKRSKETTPAKQPDDIRIMTNLEECAHAADKVLLEVTTEHYRSSTGGSVVGEEISDQDRERIQSWISMEKIHEEQEEKDESLPMYSSLNGLDSRFGHGKSDMGGIPQLDQSELALIELWRKEALLKYNAQLYEEAEKLLERILLEISTDSQISWRDDIMRMLAYSYHFQKKWNLAEELLRNEFKGKDEILMKLAKSYCFHCMWEEAENLVQNFSFKGRRAVLTHIATAFLRYNLLENGERILHANLESGMELTPEGSEMLHTLSQLYFADKNYDQALKYCARAIRGRGRIFGFSHVLYYQSIKLRADIHEEKGESTEAELLKCYLPKNFQGMFSLIAYLIYPSLLGAGPILPIKA
jgi:tetratricopeptide (TPR) repeat protein